MATNQESRLSSVQSLTGTALGYNGDWLTLFANEGYSTGTFNERFLKWINGRLSSSYVDLQTAMEAFAGNQGMTRWSDITTIPSAGGSPPAASLVWDAGNALSWGAAGNELLWQ
jgi:hypothetical protein